MKKIMEKIYEKNYDKIYRKKIIKIFITFEILRRRRWRSFLVLPVRVDFNYRRVFIFKKNKLVSGYS